MKRKRLVVGAYLATISIAILSLGVSLAWYIASTQLNVEAIEMSVYTDQNLLISKTPDNFEEHSLGNPLKGESSVELDLFKPVTSMYTFTEDWTSSQSFYNDVKPDDSDSETEKQNNHYYYNWLRNNEDAPVLLDSYASAKKKVPTLPERAYSGYYSEVLYLYSNSSVYVTLDGQMNASGGYNTYIEADDDANRKSAESLHPGKEDEYVEKMRNLKKSFRISVLSPNEENSDKFDYTIIDPYKESVLDSDSNLTYQDTYFAGRLNTSTGSEFDYYFDNDTQQRYEMIYGDIDESTRTPNNVLDYYDEKSGNSGIDIDSTKPESSFNAKTHPDTYPFNFEKAIQAKTDGGTQLRVAKEHSIALQELGGVDSEFRIAVKAHTPTRIVLSLYIEGWDMDCINDTMGASFTANISFKIAREMGI